MKKLKNLLDPEEDIEFRIISINGQQAGGSNIEPNKETYFIGISGDDDLKLKKVDNENTKSELSASHPLNIMRKIDHYQFINRMFTSMREEGICQFEAGKEPMIKNLECYTHFYDQTFESRLIFNGVQGILYNSNQALYFPNLKENSYSIKLNTREMILGGVVFLDKIHIAVLDAYNKKLVILDIENNGQVSEISISNKGIPTSIDIDSDKKIILVSMVEEIKTQILNEFSSCLCQYRVSHEVWQVPKIEEIGKIFEMGTSNQGVFEIKMMRISNYDNQIMILISMLNYPEEQTDLFNEGNKNSLRAYELNIISNKIQIFLDFSKLENVDLGKFIDSYEESAIIGSVLFKKLTPL